MMNQRLEEIRTAWSKIVPLDELYAPKCKDDIVYLLHLLDAETKRREVAEAVIGAMGFLTPNRFDLIGKWAQAKTEYEKVLTNGQD